MQESDWNCGNLITPNHKKKPFDDVRVRRALALALDQWKGAPALAKIATVHTVGGIVFPGSPLAATKEELEKLPGYWPDIEKSRAEAKRLLKEAGAEGLSFELLNRNVDQPYKYVAAWVIDEWRKIGLNVTQRVIPTGPFYEALRSGNFDVTVDFNCQGVVNPPLDTAKYLPHSVYTENYGQYEDAEVDRAVQQDAARARPAETARSRCAISRTTCSTPQAHEIVTPWWLRLIPHRLHERLEDQPEPLHQPGPGNGLARQIAGTANRAGLADAVLPGGCDKRTAGEVTPSRAARRALRRRQAAPSRHFCKGERRLEFATRLTLAAAFAACVATGPAVAADPPKTRRRNAAAC